MFRLVRFRLASLALLAGVGFGGGLAAQTPPPPSGRPAGRPTATPRRDTVPAAPAGSAAALRPDSAGRDTVPRIRLDSAVVALGPSDSLVARLLRIPGYRVVQYSGESAVFQADSQTLRLFGSAAKRASINRAPEEVTADTVIYSGTSNLITAFGRTEAKGGQGQQTIRGDTLRIAVDTRESEVRGGSTQLSQGGVNWLLLNANVRADENDVLRVSNGRFTTDTRGGDSVPAVERQYHFKAGRILAVKDRFIVARPVTLYFKNVPVFPLPFLYQDLTQGRRSGILTPRFGVNDIVRTSGGYTRQISNLGYYWAINDHMGAQLSGEWRSGTHTALDGQVEFRDRNRFLNGNMALREFFPQEGARQRTLRGNLSWEPDERTSLTGSADYASSSRFVRRVSLDPREATANLGSSLSLNRRFDWGSMNLGAQRQQEVSSGRVVVNGPSLAINPRPITLFPALTEADQRWFSNTSITFTANGSQSDINEPDRPNNLPDSLRTVSLDSLLRIGVPLRRDSRQGQAVLNSTVSVGNLSLTTGANLNRSTLAAFTQSEARADSLGAFQEQDQGEFNTSLSYQQRLGSFFGFFPLGQTRVSPNVQVARAVKRDTASRRFGEAGYVTGPTRLSSGMSFNTDLFGFFPGVGSLTAIRHRFSPQASYSYAPEVTQTALQDSVFGRFEAKAQNRVSFSMTNSFEAKLRPQSVRPVGTDSTSDTTGVSSPRRAAVPNDARKVVLLTLTTTALEYDFERARGDTLGGFTTRTLGNSIRSDYLRGLDLNITHELFDPDPERSDRARVVGGLRQLRPGDLGTFDPHIAQVSASFSLGAGSALFRWLGLAGSDIARNPEQDRRNDGLGVVPGQHSPSLAPGANQGGSFNDNPQRTGSGPWNMQFRYALTRARPPRRAVGVSRNQFDSFNSEGQTVDVTGNFQLSENWAANVNTQYSITDQEFAGYIINLRRNLFRWQADFDILRTATGNTSFSFAVRLSDLPDLKFDYRERNIGLDRPQSQ